MMSKSKIGYSEFKKFHEILKDQLTEICTAVVDGKSYSLLELSKKIDRLVYRYTGDESLIVDTDENNKKKILVIEEVIEQFHCSQANFKQILEEAKASNKIRRKNFLHLLPSITDGDISKVDVLVTIFGGIIVRHIIQVKPEAFKLMCNPPENLGDDLN
jgi:hypothetical protein